MVVLLLKKRNGDVSRVAKLWNMIQVLIKVSGQFNFFISVINKIIVSHISQKKCLKYISETGLTLLY